MKAQKRLKQFLITMSKQFFEKPYGGLEFYGLTMMLFMPKKKSKNKYPIVRKINLTTIIYTSEDEIIQLNLRGRRS